jgi:hypothetical protein
MLTCFKVKNFKRNEKCDCGSGKKTKNCCRSENEYDFVDKRKEENKTNSTEAKECPE